MLKTNFQPFPELKTKRLLLRKLVIDDAPLLYILRSDERIMEFLGRPKASSLTEVEEFIKKINSGIDEGENILWGISMLDEPNKLIGTICYWQFNRESCRVETGYVLHPDYWRKGIMKEALLKIIDYGFDVMKLHSIEARLAPANIASISLLESTGFVKEGHFKEDFYYDGKFLDTLVYSRLHR